MQQPDGYAIDDDPLPVQTERTQVDAARYFPIEVRVSATVLALSDTFPGWQ